MTGHTVRLLLTAFFFAPIVLHGAEATTFAKVNITIERGEGSKLKLEFPAAANRRYQVYASQDLRTWEFVGSLINGSNRLITIDYSTTNEARNFFRVETRPVTFPVATRIERDNTGDIKLRFPTLLGYRYQVFSSDDLLHWFAFSDLIDGNGTDIAPGLDPKEASKNFFEVESVDVVHLPNMVWIRPGSFVMGSPPVEKDRDLDEDPLTEVIFPLGFWMGKHEVTQREYEKVMTTNPSWFKGDSSRPVEQVSWDEAVAYCTRLTQMEFLSGRLPPGYAYRLPTEAEFEYACRAGTTTRFNYGDDLDYSQLPEYAWYSANSEQASHPVGQKKPNGFGLYDMHGNVWEWCLDWYRERYPGGTVERPLGPATGQTRIFRGGGWDYHAHSCRSAYRNSVAPSQRRLYVGFRVVLAPVLP